MTYNNTFESTVRALWHDVESRDSATGRVETSFKKVGLKANDFANKSSYDDYKKLCTKVAVEFVDAYNSDKSTTKAIKKAGDELWKKILTGYIRNSGLKQELFTRDCKYIRDSLVSTRLDKQSKELCKLTGWEKVSNAIQELLYHKLNGLPLPNLSLNKSTSKIYTDMQLALADTIASASLAQEMEKISREQEKIKAQEKRQLSSLLESLEKSANMCKDSLESWQELLAYEMARNATLNNLLMTGNDDRYTSSKLESSDNWIKEVNKHITDSYKAIRIAENKRDKVATMLANMD